MRPVSLRSARRHQAHRRALARRPSAGSAVALMLATVTLLVLFAPWLRPAVANAGAQAQKALGLVVAEVRIDGTNRVEVSAIGHALAIEPQAPILQLDLEAARHRVEELAWVEHAVVRRVLPDAVEVRVTEHEPLALWLGPDGRALLSAAGATVPVTDVETPRDLPLVTGAGAANEAAAIGDILMLAERLGRDVRRLERVAEQRWRVVLEPSLRIELPADGAEAALVRLEAHARERDLLDRAVSVIDLRVKDRLVLMPAPTLKRAEAG